MPITGIHMDGRSERVGCGARATHGLASASSLFPFGAGHTWRCLR
jgi:hypothetical protein